MRENTRFLVDSEYESKGLVVLCHGWHGDLIKTWGDLHRVAWRTDRLAGLDLLFVGYRTSPTSIDLLASSLANILMRVFPVYRNGLLLRQYEFLILVGHSLGTLALRKAILRLYRQSQQLDEHARAICESSKQVLFAPPLLGVDWPLYIDAIREACPNWLTRLLLPFISGVEPVSADLATNSQFVADLREGTSAILENDPESFPLAHVVLGSADRVIQVDEIDDLLYPKDTHEVIIDATHVSVCKVAIDDPDSRVLDLVRTRTTRSVPGV
jgi:hypothetical protein